MDDDDGGLEGDDEDDAALEAMGSAELLTGGGGAGVARWVPQPTVKTSAATSRSRPGAVRRPGRSELR